MLHLACYPHAFTGTASTFPSRARPADVPATNVHRPITRPG